MKFELTHLHNEPNGSLYLFITVFDENSEVLGNKLYVIEKTTRKLRNARRHKADAQ